MPSLSFSRTGGEAQRGERELTQLGSGQAKLCGTSANSCPPPVSLEQGLAMDDVPDTGLQSRLKGQVQRPRQHLPGEGIVTNVAHVVVT